MTIERDSQAPSGEGKGGKEAGAVMVGGGENGKARVLEVTLPRTIVKLRDVKLQVRMSVDHIR